MVVGVAGDDPAAAAPHPLTFHDDLTLAEAESERLGEMADSLRHRQRVGVNQSVFHPASSAPPCSVHFTAHKPACHLSVHSAS